jgi:hypothetical protein
MERRLIMRMMMMRSSERERVSSQIFDNVIDCFL